MLGLLNRPFLCSNVSVATPGFAWRYFSVGIAYIRRFGDSPTKRNGLPSQVGTHDHKTCGTLPDIFPRLRVMCSGL